MKSLQFCTEKEFRWRGFVVKSTPLIPRQRGKFSILPLWRGQGGGKKRQT